MVVSKRRVDVLGLKVTDLADSRMENEIRNNIYQDKDRITAWGTV